METRKFKAEKREQKLKKRRKRVSGRGVFLLAKIIAKK